MRIIYVDDEKNALINFEYEIKQLACVSSYQLFNDENIALEYARTHDVDIAFLDMELRHMTGFDLAKKLQKINSNTIIVYVTAYSKYALEAYRSGGRAYLLKPYTSEEVSEIFQFLQRIYPPNNDIDIITNELRNPQSENVARVFIKTFGDFDIFIDNEPIIFRNAKSKELLALLVNQKGGVLTNKKIFSDLWEDTIYTPATSTYVRRTLQVLRTLLAEHNCENLVLFHRNAIHINYPLFQKGYYDCDLFRIFEGDSHYLHDYDGQYMSQYSWAETSIYALENKMRSIAKDNPYIY